MAKLIGGRIVRNSEPEVIVSVIPLAIPADTWTEIPLPTEVSRIFDFKIIENGIDISSTVVSQKTTNSFEILSLNSLTTTIITEGV